MKSKRPCKAETSSSNIISTLPLGVLETILCFLPTEDAARTSILSKEWRYKWTKLPKLEFYLSQLSKTITNEEEVNVENTDKICKLFDDVLKMLSSHKSLIHEFALYIDIPEAYESEADHESFGLDEIILHLLKNHTLKKLKLYGLEFTAWFYLPASVFSFHHLTDLYLAFVDIDHQPIFNRFGSLESLVLEYVKIPTKTMLRLLSNCPSLKRFSLIKGLSNDGDKSCTIAELFACLPVIEHLTFFSFDFEWLVLDSVRKELPASLFHLKYFCFEGVSFVEAYGLAFLLVLIKCSPNLEKIKLEINWDLQCYDESTVIREEYSEVWLEHLVELEIDYFRNSKPEMEFVKFILARSPKLKKVSIKSWVYVDEMLKVLQILLRAPRASRNLCLIVDSINVRSVNFLKSVIDPTKATTEDER